MMIYSAAAAARLKLAMNQTFVRLFNKTLISEIVAARSRTHLYMYILPIQLTIECIIYQLISRFR